MADNDIRVEFSSHDAALEGMMILGPKIGAYAEHDAGIPGDNVLIIPMRGDGQIMRTRITGIADGIRMTLDYFAKGEV